MKEYRKQINKLLKYSVFMTLVFSIIFLDCYALESLKQGDRRSLDMRTEGLSIALFFFVSEKEYLGKGKFYYDFQIENVKNKKKYKIYNIVGVDIETELLRHFRMVKNLLPGEYQITHAIYLDENRNESIRKLKTKKPITFKLKENEVVFKGAFRLSDPNSGEPELMVMDEEDMESTNEFIKEPRIEDCSYAKEARKSFILDNFYALTAFAEFYPKSDWTKDLVLPKLKEYSKEDKYKKQYEEFNKRLNKRLGK